jgi:hypothetical protein
MHTTEGKAASAEESGFAVDYEKFVTVVNGVIVGFIDGVVGQPIGGALLGVARDAIRRRVKVSREETRATEHAASAAL